MTSFKPLSSHNRFVGITLPVDVNMIFEVIEGEDRRSTVDKQKSPEQSLAEKLADISNVNSEVDSAERKDSQIETVAASERDYRLRGGSMNEQSSSATPGSQTSTTSSDSASKKLTEDNEEGRRLIRSEVLRLIVNLSSSVGLKASEQGLLSLKQRFPSMFKDICFFSEVCLLLSSYSFRLNSRRFIQELFDEINITKLVEGPKAFLGITDDNGPRMAPIRQDSMDSFKDFS